jgi:hypothetical protein
MLVAGASVGMAPEISSGVDGVVPAQPARRRDNKIENEMLIPIEETLSDLRIRVNMAKLYAHHPGIVDIN